MVGMNQNIVDHILRQKNGDPEPKAMNATLDVRLDGIEDVVKSAVSDKLGDIKSFVYGAKTPQTVFDDIKQEVAQLTKQVHAIKLPEADQTPILKAIEGLSRRFESFKAEPPKRTFTHEIRRGAGGLIRSIESVET